MQLYFFSLESFQSQASILYIMYKRSEDSILPPVKFSNILCFLIAFHILNKDAILSFLKGSLYFDNDFLAKWKQIAWISSI